MVDGHEKSDFWLYQLFLIRPFFDLWHLENWPKNDRSQKIDIIKNQFFHARQPRKGIFEIYPLLGCFLMTSFPELLMAAAIPGVEIFSWKSAWVVFFYMQNSKFWVNPESEGTGFALLYKPHFLWCNGLQKLEDIESDIVSDKKTISLRSPTMDSRHNGKKPFSWDCYQNVAATFTQYFVFQRSFARLNCLFKMDKFEFLTKTIFTTDGPEPRLGSD